MSKEQITGLIQKALDKAVADGLLPEVDAGHIELDRPNRKEHGDWATNVALARSARAHAR
jgi:arginyl-tRNA synthetase